MLCGGKHKHADPASMPAPRRRYVSRLCHHLIDIILDMCPTFGCQRQDTSLTSQSFVAPRAKDVLRQSGQRQPRGLAHLVQVPEYACVRTCVLPKLPDVRAGNFKMFPRAVGCMGRMVNGRALSGCILTRVPSKSRSLSWLLLCLILWFAGWSAGRLPCDGACAAVLGLKRYLGNTPNKDMKVVEDMAVGFRLTDMQNVVEVFPVKSRPPRSTVAELRSAARWMNRAGC
eukprot:6481836-Amphidinium_carterae.4